MLCRLCPLDILESKFLRNTNRSKGQMPSLAFLWMGLILNNATEIRIQDEARWMQSRSTGKPGRACYSEGQIGRPGGQREPWPSAESQ